MWNDPAVLTPLAALAGVLLTTMFNWAAKRLEVQSAQPKARTDALVAANNKLAELADRFETMWRADHEKITSLERRVGLLESEVVRLGGDPASINGGGS